MTISGFHLHMVQSKHPIERVPRMPEWKAASIQEAAEKTGYHPEYLRQLCRDKRIEFVRVGRVYLVKWESLQAYIRKQQESGDGRGGPRK